jgi:hypothetical protein
VRGKGDGMGIMLGGLRYEGREGRQYEIVNEEGKGRGREAWRAVRMNRKDGMHSCYNITTAIIVTMTKDTNNDE